MTPKILAFGALLLCMIALIAHPAKKNNKRDIIPIVIGLLFALIGTLILLVFL